MYPLSRDAAWRMVGVGCIESAVSPHCSQFFTMTDEHWCHRQQRGMPTFLSVSRSTVIKTQCSKHRQMFFTGSALAMRQTCDFGLVVALVTGFSGVLNILKTSGVKEISLLAFSECAKMVFRMDHSTYAEKQSSALIKMGVIPHPMNTHY